MIQDADSELRYATVLRHAVLFVPTLVSLTNPGFTDADMHVSSRHSETKLSAEIYLGERWDEYASVVEVGS
jgi:hypothetical protein